MFFQSILIIQIFIGRAQPTCGWAWALPGPPLATPLLGGFNVNHIHREALFGHSPSSAKLCEIIFDLNLCQLGDKPTHFCGNILDLVLTNNPNNMIDLTAYLKQPLLILSNYFVIIFKSYFMIVYPSNKVDIKQRNSSRGGFEGLCHYLST